MKLSDAIKRQHQIETDNVNKRNEETRRKQMEAHERMKPIIDALDLPCEFVKDGGHFGYSGDNWGYRISIESGHVDGSVLVETVSGPTYAKMFLIRRGTEGCYTPLCVEDALRAIAKLLHPAQLEKYARLLAK